MARGSASSTVGSNGPGPSSSRAPAARSSRASASSRSRSAERASAAMVPRPSSVSRRGSRARARTRPYAGSLLCGSTHAVRPAASQAATVVVLATPRRGRTKRPRRVGIPDRDRAPEPRARPSRTCSAWSSRVWPSMTATAPTRSATSSKARYRASLARAPGPEPDDATWTVTTSTGSRPRFRHWSAPRPATAEEPSCRPWSTITAPADRPHRGASKATAAASARESAPPLQATSTSPPGTIWVSSRRTATRVAAMARCGPVMYRRRSSVDALDPACGVLDLLGQGQRLRRGPHRVETVGADPVSDRPDERGPVAVLTHLGLEAEQPPQDLVHATHVLAPLLEPGPDLLDAGHHRRPHVVHHHVGVSLEQRHDRGDPGDLCLLYTSPSP